MTGSVVSGGDLVNALAAPSRTN